MPALSRSFLITLGVTLFIFLALSSWYWLQFKQPSSETLRGLVRVIPVVEKLLDAHEDTKAASLLDRLPLKVVVTDTDNQAVASNLGGSLKQRQEMGQQAINSGLTPRNLPSQNGHFLFYYQLPSEWLDPQLLFPLFFAMLMGLLAGLWDFLQRIHDIDQTDALLALSHLPGVTHAPAGPAEPESDKERSGHESRIQELEQKNRSLQAALTEAKRWVLAAPDEETKQMQQQLRKFEQTVQDRDQKLHLAHLAEQKLREQKLELEAKCQSWEAQARERETEARSLKQKNQKQDEENTKLHQDLQRLARDLESGRGRLEELEAQSAQLHEAWQEITALRSTVSEMLLREEAWKKEKQRVLALMHEKEEALEQTRERLKTSRQKIHELSVAYKKQLEMANNLPEDLSDARNVLASLLDEKDHIERENAQLQIELADRSSETTRLRKELEIRAARLDEAQKMIEDLASELRKHERELGLLSETLSDKLKDLDNLKDLHDEKAQVLEATAQERDQLRMRLSDLQAELENLREEKGRLLYAKEQLEEQVAHIDVAAYELEIAQLRQSMQLMTQQQQRRSQTVEQLKAKLKEGEDIYSRLKRHSDKQEQDIRGLQQEISMFQSEIALLQEKVGHYERADFEAMVDEGYRM
ncbi:MAG TPA: hypothetical protein V6D23_11885 [Candidatus Obscuribacterales bacterium]